jgi:hypothetical protein
LCDKGSAGEGLVSNTIAEYIGKYGIEEKKIRRISNT